MLEEDFWDLVGFFFGLRMKHLEKQQARQQVVGPCLDSSVFGVQNLHGEIQVLRSSRSCGVPCHAVKQRTTVGGVSHTDRIRYQNSVKCATTSPVRVA